MSRHATLASGSGYRRPPSSKPATSVASPALTASFGGGYFSARLNIPMASFQRVSQLSRELPLRGRSQALTTSLQRHRCKGYTGANRRLARWFRANIDGWDRVQVGHELRKLNISMVICSSGSMYQGSKHAGHSSIKVTETTYGDLLNKKKVEIPLPSSS